MMLKVLQVEGRIWGISPTGGTGNRPWGNVAKAATIRFGNSELQVKEATAGAGKGYLDNNSRQFSRV